MEVFIEPFFVSTVILWLSSVRRNMCWIYLIIKFNSEAQTEQKYVVQFQVYILKYI